MTGRYGRALTIVAVVGSGLVAGVFFAFSTFVMTALGRLPDRQGLRAMQEINDAAPTPLFILALFGTTAVCVALAVLAIRRRSELPTVQLLVGGALYLAGIVVTIAYHIPKNDDLALVNPNSAGAADAWNDYRTSWTAWNHVRTLAFLGATVAFVLALSAFRRSGTTWTAAEASDEQPETAQTMSSGVPR